MNGIAFVMQAKILSNLIAKLVNLWDLCSGFKLVERTNEFLYNKGSGLSQVLLCIL